MCRLFLGLVRFGVLTLYQYSRFYSRSGAPSPGDMPAKSIASFFSKPAAKKPTEEVKDEGKENRAITKDPTSGAAER